MTEPTTRPRRFVDQADLQAAGSMPCRLAGGAFEVLHPWLGNLSDQALTELEAMLVLVELASRRLELLTTHELPKADDALIGALAARAYFIGLRATASELLLRIEERACEAAHEAAVIELARERLWAVYGSDPAKARADGLGALAGSLLT